MRRIELVAIRFQVLSMHKTIDLFSDIIQWTMRIECAKCQRELMLDPVAHSRMYTHSILPIL